MASPGLGGWAKERAGEAASGTGTKETADGSRSTTRPGVPALPRRATGSSRRGRPSPRSSASTPQPARRPRPAWSGARPDNRRMLAPETGCFLIQAGTGPEPTMSKCNHPLTVAVFVAISAIAVVVYEKVSLATRRRAWFNFDRI